MTWVPGDDVCMEPSHYHTDDGHVWFNTYFLVSAAETAQNYFTSSDDEKTFYLDHGVEFELRPRITGLRHDLSAIWVKLTTASYIEYHLRFG